MFRKLHKRLPIKIKGFRYYSDKPPGPVNFTDKNVAFESEYYYRQDRELLKILKEKTEEELKSMEKKVRSMHEKIQDYNRDIVETLKFLKTLENDLVSFDDKKTP